MRNAMVLLNPALRSDAARRPVGNLLFFGPTGSGKTRVVEALAEALFGTALMCRWKWTTVPSRTVKEQSRPI